MLQIEQPHPAFPWPDQRITFQIGVLGMDQDPDEHTRECLAIDLGSSIRSARVIQCLSKLASFRGAPRHLRSDNGPEFVLRAILAWAIGANIETALIDPGRRRPSGANESCNGKFRTSTSAFGHSRTEPARVSIEVSRDILFSALRGHHLFRTSRRHLLPSSQIQPGSGGGAPGPSVPQPLALAPVARSSSRSR